MNTGPKKKAKPTRKRENGGGTFTTLPSGKVRGQYCVRNPKTGLTERVSITEKTKALVQDEYQKLLARLNEGGPARESTMTVEDLVEEHLKTSAEKKGTTLRGYRSIAKTTLIPALGKVRLKDLTQRAIQNALCIEGEDKAPSRQRALAILSGACERAIEWGLIRKNPCKGFHKWGPRVEADDVSGNYWSKTQVQAFLAWCRPVDLYMYRMVRVAVSAGWREGEQLAMKRQGLYADDASQGFIVTQRMDLGTGKLDLVKQNRRGYRMDMPEGDMQEVAAMLETHTSEYVFADPETGKVPRWTLLDRFKELIGKYNAQEGVEPLPAITWHGLRHTCATILFGAGVPIKIVSERLGHGDISITLLIYTHVLPTMQKMAVDYMASLHDTEDDQAA